MGVLLLLAIIAFFVIVSFFLYGIGPISPVAYTVAFIVLPPLILGLAIYNAVELMRSLAPTREPYPGD